MNEQQSNVISIPFRGGTLTAPAHDHARGPENCPTCEALASFERARAAEELRAARWPSDGHKAMAALARLFPSMANVDAVDPWDAAALVCWLNSGAPTSGSRHAAMFLLNVWNTDTDWRTQGLKVKAGFGRFNLGRAMASWDHEHRAACLRWIEAPFWP